MGQHRLEGRTFPLELHLLHYSSDYSSLGEATSQEGGVVLLAVPFEVSSYQPTALLPFLPHIEDLMGGAAPHLTLPSLSSLLPRDPNPFYRYSSLPSHSCGLSSLTLLHNTLSVSKDQLALLQLLGQVIKQSSQHYLCLLCQPPAPAPQPLENRTILAGNAFLRSNAITLSFTNLKQGETRPPASLCTGAGGTEEGV